MTKKEQLISEISAMLEFRDEDDVEIAMNMVKEFLSVLDGQCVRPGECQFLQ
ncbi:MAG: hypothetical protein ACI4WS_14630 [Oscillospiraceae bacterium]